MFEKFTPEQRTLLHGYIHDLRTRLEDKPKRFRHSISVATTAARLGIIYGQDPYTCYVAGLLHDWDKALSFDELISKAQEEGATFSVSLDLVAPLIHGKTAAITLHRLYPELSDEQLQAIDRHTTGGSNMSDLDMIIFTADLIEPLRGEDQWARELRSLVGNVSLKRLYLKAFERSIIHVIETDRYLYPYSLALYNALVLNT